MESINELPLRRLLKKNLPPAQLCKELVQFLSEHEPEWEEKRPVWHFLLQTGHERFLAQALDQAFKMKERVPFDVFITLMARSKVRPERLTIEALLKGLRKQEALDEVIVARGWDSFDPRLAEIRTTLLKQKKEAHQRFRDGLKDKFEFLINQRMEEQAGRVLRRMLDLYPDDEEFRHLKRNFDEQWARNVLANHRASTLLEKIEATLTEPSPSDDEMLDCFIKEGEKICLENRDFAADLAVTFLFMEEYARAVESMAWAPLTTANEWMRVELLLRARRYIEALEALAHLEIKYVDNPETTFAVSYLRAKCLHASGQTEEAINILKSLVRVRPNYRSAQSLLLEWSEGVTWD